MTTKQYKEKKKVWKKQVQQIQQVYADTLKTKKVEQK